MLGCIQPMSSPIIKSMLGFCCCCCAAAGVFTTVSAMAVASTLGQICLAMLMVMLLLLWAAHDGLAAFARWIASSLGQLGAKHFASAVRVTVWVFVGADLPSMARHFLRANNS